MYRVHKPLELVFTFVYKEVCEVLPNKNGVGVVWVIVRRSPFVCILLRVELNSIDRISFVLEAGHELQTLRVPVDCSHLPVPVQTRRRKIL